MNTASVLAAFDQQVRRWPEAAPGDTVEHADHVIRHVSRTDGWSGVVWSDLDAGNADAVIAAQIAHFSALAQDWEWKHYSYDQPRDLPERLRAAGFDTEPTETLLVAEVSELGPSAHAPGGVEIRSVRTAEEVDALLTVHAAAFGQDDAGLRELMLASLSSDDPHVEAVVAWADGAPIAAGRVEFYGGTEFAGLWGGGTLPGWRHRGVFRALVSHRAGLAARRGYRYLQVDAEDTSRPIFERLGFAELAKTTPFTYRSPRAGARSGEKPEAYGRSA